MANLSKLYHISEVKHWVWELQDTDFSRTCIKYPWETLSHIYYMATFMLYWVKPASSICRKLYPISITWLPFGFIQLKLHQVSVGNCIPYPWRPLCIITCSFFTEYPLSLWSHIVYHVKHITCITIFFNLNT